MKAFTAEFDADLKGLAISNSEAIRKAHNSFARPEPIMEEQRDQAPSDDVFHFIAYMPVNGRLYELDGLKRGPIAHGECTDDDWLGKVCPVIQSRIEQYASSEIRFNLTSSSPQAGARGGFAKIEARKERCAKVAAGAAVDTGMDVDGGDDLDGPLPRGRTRAAELARLERAAVAREGIEREAQKGERWRDENIRRKHNYIPFIFNFLKVLAEKKKLEPLIAKARGQ